MAVEIYQGYAPKPVVDKLVSRYGMVMSNFIDEVIYKDDSFLAFSADSKLPIMLQAPSGRLTRSSLNEMLGSKTSKITDLKLPNTITSIAPDAFDDMSSLEALTFSYSTQVQTIEANTFKDCQSLKVLKLGNGITTIEDGAFQNATSLQVLALPFTLENISETFIEHAPAALETISFVPAEYQLVDVEVSKIDDEKVEFDISGIDASGLVRLLSQHLADFDYVAEDNKLTFTYTSSKSKPALMSSSKMKVFKAKSSDNANGFFTTPTQETINVVMTVTASVPVHIPSKTPYGKCTETTQPCPTTGSGSASYIELTPDIGGINHSFDPDDPKAAAEYNKIMDAYEKFKADVEKQNAAAKDAAMTAAIKKAQDDINHKLSTSLKVRGLPCPVCEKPVDDNGDFDYGGGEDDFS